MPKNLDSPPLCPSIINVHSVFLHKFTIYVIFDTISSNASKNRFWCTWYIGRGD